MSTYAHEFDNAKNRDDLRVKLAAGTSIRLAWESLAISRGRAHDEAMARNFRFRVREGHQIIEFRGDGTTTRGAGFEFVLSEQEAASVLRQRANRHAVELVEVIADAEAATPPTEPPVHE